MRDKREGKRQKGEKAKREMGRVEQYYRIG